MTNVTIQNSFASGEIPKQGYARQDYKKYANGAALMENYYVDYRGGAVNRQGSMIVGQCLQNPSNRFDTRYVRLIPFTFSTIQTYMLEFGHLYVRVIKDGAYVLEAGKTITAITNATTAVITSAAHGFNNGDIVYISSVAGMTNINNNYYAVANKTANTFEIRIVQTDVDVNSLGWPIRTTGGTAARVYTLTSPYASTELELLKFSQNKDTMTLTHVSYPIYDLTRSAHASWSFTSLTIGATIGIPTIASVTPALGAGSTGYTYIVSAINADGTEEGVASSFMSTGVAKTMSSNPTENVSVVWGAVAGASRYNIYRTLEVPNGNAGSGSAYGYIGTTTALTFVDANIDPDFSRSPVVSNYTPFSGVNYPACNTNFLQRHWYAGSTSFPETFWASQIANRKNFNKTNPVRDNESIEGTLSSLQMNAINDLVPMPTGLIALTRGNAFQISGGALTSGGAPAAIGPSTVTAFPQAFNGSDPTLSPIVVDYDIFYVQAMGATVRTLAYNFYVNTYTGDDISVFSSHLFENYMLKSWCYAIEPYKAFWIVRNDGNLLNCAYLKSQEVIGWSWHSTTGLWRSVAQIQEGDETAIYAIVERYFANRWLKYVERFASRRYTEDLSRAWFVDSGLQTGMTYPVATLTASAVSGELITFTASSGIFTAADVTKTIRMNNGVAVIVEYVSTTVVKCDVKLTLSSLYPAISGEWSIATPIMRVQGLEHLEGEAVYGLADGEAFGPKYVMSGGITLDKPASLVVAGKQIVSNLKTLYIDTGEPTIQSKRKKITRTTARVAYTKGIKIGHDENDLYPWKGEQVLESAGYSFSNTLAQEYSTTNASSVTHFSSGGDDFLFTTFYFDPEKTGDRFALNSLLQKKNTTTGLYEDHQLIPTIGATDAKWVNVGARQFLVIAAGLSDITGYTCSTVILEWNVTTKLFNTTPFQSVTTTGAQRLDYFVDGSDHYLSFACSIAADGVTRTCDSFIHKWDGTTFALDATISTVGCYHLRLLKTADGNFFACEASYYDGVNYNRNSRIFIKSGASFVFHQNIATSGCVYWGMVQVSSSGFFIGAANSYNGYFFDIVSRVYVYNTGTQFFDLFQEIMTRNCQMITTMTDVVGDQFFCFVNTCSGNNIIYPTSDFTSSTIDVYKYTGSFGYKYSVKAVGAYGVATWLEGTTLKMAIANSYNAIAITTGETLPGATVQIKSYIMNIKSTSYEGFAEWPSLQTGDIFVNIDPRWDRYGQIYIRQELPYPTSILGVMNDLTVGDT
jgi:hypothetical protein